MPEPERVFPRATRVEIIDATGRQVVRHYHEPGVSVIVQDEGRTLKVFAGTPKE